MDDLLASNGFWFAIGILAGVLIDVLARALVRWWNQPILKCPNDTDRLRDFEITVVDYRSGSIGLERQRVAVWRLKVRNEGRSAAVNVRGTIIPVYVGEREGPEQRIPWYEPPRQAITLNREDHSYLDLYGVRVEAAGVTREICMPNEEGWGAVGRPIYGFPAEKMPRFRLRITARNCKPLLLEFKIDERVGCVPSVIN